MSAGTARFCAAFRPVAPRGGPGVAVACVASLLVLAAIYGVVGLYTGLPRAITAGDAPRFAALTGSEHLDVVGSGHSGVASTRILLPVETGTQGAFYTSAAPGPRRFVASLWVRGVVGKAYSVVVTQNKGFARSPSRSFLATGKWQRVAVTVSLHPGDSIVHLAVFRARRGGEESFFVDDVRVAPRRR